jgi:hypothetical protein
MAQEEHRTEYRRTKIIRRIKKEAYKKRLEAGIERIIDKKTMEKIKYKKVGVLKLGDTDSSHCARQDDRRKKGQYDKLSYDNSKGK